MITLKSYLCGEWQQGRGEGTTLVNPATEEPVAKASTDGLDLRAALDYGREVGGPKLRAMTFAERGELLKKMSKAIHEAREELIEASTLNGGTTRSDGKFDIDGASATLAYYAELGRELGDRTYLVDGDGAQLTRSQRFWAHHVKTPRRGVAVHVNAFNFPAWGLAEKASVALLAGVPVVSKPATATALLTFRCVEKILETGALPEGALQLLCGSPGDLLEHLGPQDMLSFTGSGATGSRVRSLPNVVGRSVRVNVEADSLNVAVLAPNVERGSDGWAMFVRNVVHEMTQKTGQKCTAIRRIFVPKTMLDEAQEALVEELSRIRVGNPANKEVHMGPLATRQQLDDVRSGVDKLVSAGARVVFGRTSDVEPFDVQPGKGHFVTPVLLRADDPQAAAAVHEHEVFGPVATLMPYDDASHVAGLVARGDGGLVASVYGDDRDTLRTLLFELAPYNGRVLLGTSKIADQATPPGLVLPSCVHGGPGRAGGGEELGGIRGLDFYMQRTAVQGDRAMLERLLDIKSQ